MNTFLVILMALIVVILAFMLIVCIPVLFGKLFFKWSKQRVKYIFSTSFSTIVSTVIVSLILTGLILLIGVVFKAQWAFSGGLLIVFVFWTAIKSVIQCIKESKNM